MAADRESSAPLVDVAAVVVAPALVMLMVGSLTFFLIDVLYAGQWPERLLYTFFFFVFGAVLIARLSIQFGRRYAAMYAGGLGFACFVAMLAYVEYPPGVMKAVGPVVNLGLMALVWWAADKLTWDCTHFDDDKTASGRGVLAAAGLDAAADQPPEPPEEEPPPDKKKRRRKPEDGLLGWVEKYRAHQKAQNKKPHTPGVWVLRFSLAAVPLFALGQSLVAPDDDARRLRTFLEMAVYVGSGLGLLVTTTLMGLKRYLEQRNARIPVKLTAAWLGLGGGLIVLFLVIGAVIPRPHSETPWFGMQRAGSSDRDASKYAVVKDGSAGKGEGAAGNKTEAGDGKNSAKGGEQTGGNGGEKGSGGGKGQSQSGGQQSNGGQGGGQGDKSGPGNDQSDGKDKSQANGKPGDPQKNKGKDGQKGKADGGREQGGGSESGDEARDADGNTSDGDRDGESSGPTRVSEMFDAVGSFLKWVVWGLIAIAVVGCLLFFGLKWLAPFTSWAQGLLDWLKGLFARKKTEGRKKPKDEEQTEEDVYRPPPFADFPNPFADGSAAGRSPRELVEYTFAAFDAWAWDRGQGRQPGETPMEFAVRIGHGYADLDEPGFRVANLYARALYSRAPLPGDTLRALESLWDRLEAVPAGR